ncbi:MAG: DUF434 domain-containing protein [Myxococcota bacterium]
MGRGAHQADATLFSASQVPILQEAVADLGWLYGRGYVDPSATKLVGDRYRLRQRQRVAISRGAASSDQLARRAARRVAKDAVAGQALAIDGFNVLIGLETALAGGVLLRGADGVLRDLASVHGSYRRVEATAAAIDALVQTLVSWAPASVTWVLDRPVSNSGRLAGWLRDAAPVDIAWSVQLPYDADQVVIDADAIACSSDARVLECTERWADLLTDAVTRHAPNAWVVSLTSRSTSGLA